jgi:hypothetical protein
LWGWRRAIAGAWRRGGSGRGWEDLLTLPVALVEKLVEVVA